ncbi:prepilin-type N-terminal cleavage/methylation domain-containing protein [Aliarcobacter butzleri]|uniref:prepilin-type N-terminal cleavage/methylation domain-containing protein n=1 Tax=Aliarcobacter butzleri TaxID=28197 RepID=UPI0021B1C2BF|nr:prepilin-type N-terminal cleavage/methylation domain-containing protein [Aliarcobacter butzleri]MCT7596077.1 prepilin-type N-terminal cleavage/methylation domain-containing protein [Aliarcobacter butzleri]
MKNIIIKKVKKGFSMIELLFVMVALAALTAIAIPSMSSGTDSAKFISTTTDAKNLINLLYAEQSKTGDLSQVISVSADNCESRLLTGTTCFKDNNNDGFADSKLLTGAEIALSKDNEIALDLLNCADFGGIGTGFLIGIVNTKTGGVTEVAGDSTFIQKGIEYNSCTDSKFKEIGMSTNDLTGESGK